MSDQLRPARVGVGGAVVLAICIAAVAGSVFLATASVGWTILAVVLSLVLVVVIFAVQRHTGF